MRLLAAVPEELQDASLTAPYHKFQPALQTGILVAEFIHLLQNASQHSRLMCGPHKDRSACANAPPKGLRKFQVRKIVLDIDPLTVFQLCPRLGERVATPLEGDLLVRVEARTTRHGKR